MMSEADTPLPESAAAPTTAPGPTTTPGLTSPKPAQAGQLGIDFSSMASFTKLVRIDTKIEPTILGELKYTATELAELTGATIKEVEDYTRWLGRPNRDPKAAKFTDSDADVIRYLREYAVENNMSYKEMGSMIRGMAWMLYRLAMHQSDALINHISEVAEVGDAEARLLAADFIPKQSEVLTPVIAQIWRRQLAAAVRQMTTSAIAQRGVYGDDRDYPIQRSIGFADLVSFTERTESASAHEFYDLVREFHDRCWDIIANRGGRTISFIGDAVLFAGDDINVGAEVSLGLAEPGALGECGQVRVGLVWTRVITTHGDVFGPGVNMASRIASAGIPGEVFVGPGVAAQLIHVPRYQVVPYPPFEARGLGLVEPSRLRYANDPRNGDESADS